MVQQAERIMRWVALAFCALAVLGVSLSVMAHFGMMDAFLMPAQSPPDPGRPACGTSSGGHQEVDCK